MPGTNDAGASDAELDIQSLLSGTSDTDTAGQEAAESELAQGAQAADVFKFGGRQYKSQEEAEKAHNTLYGKYSEQQGIVKRLKQLLSDPKALQTLSRDPKWAPIIAKLGIQQAEEEAQADEEVAGEAEEEFDWSTIPEPLQKAYRQMEVSQASIGLEREEWAFERKLGRPITDDEHNAVMRLIQKHDQLTYAEAWKLAFHDKMLKEAQAERGKASADKTRPRPIPGIGMPGVKMDTKKRVEDMTGAEFREHLRQSDEFKNLMSRE